MQMYQGKEILGIKDDIQSPFDLHKLTVRGLPRKAITQLEKSLCLKDGEIAPLLHISPRMITRYKKEKSRKNLNSDITERILRIAEVVARCREVFEDKELSNTWLKTKNMVLGYVEPLKLLNSYYGIDVVLEELVRIEHGIIA